MERYGGVRDNAPKTPNYSLCVQTREDRNKFVEDTAGMIKAERESHYEEFYM